VDKESIASIPRVFKDEVLKARRYFTNKSVPSALTPYIKTELISSMTDAQMIAAIDIDEDGKIDIMA